MAKKSAVPESITEIPIRPSEVRINDNTIDTTKLNLGIVKLLDPEKTNKVGRDDINFRQFLNDFERDKYNTVKKYSQDAADKPTNSISKNQDLLKDLRDDHNNNKEGEEATQIEGEEGGADEEDVDGGEEAAEEDEEDDDDAESLNISAQEIGELSQKLSNSSRSKDSLDLQNNFPEDSSSQKNSEFSTDKYNNNNSTNNKIQVENFKRAFSTTPHINPPIHSVHFPQNHTPINSQKNIQFESFAAPLSVSSNKSQNDLFTFQFENNLPRSNTSSVSASSYSKLLDLDSSKGRHRKLSFSDSPARMPVRFDITPKMSDNNNNTIPFRQNHTPRPDSSVASIFSFNNNNHHHHNNKYNKLSFGEESINNPLRQTYLKPITFDSFHQGTRKVLSFDNIPDNSKYTESNNINYDYSKVLPLYDSLPQEIPPMLGSTGPTTVPGYASMPPSNSNYNQHNMNNINNNNIHQNPQTTNNNNSDIKLSEEEANRINNEIRIHNMKLLIKMAETLKKPIPPHIGPESSSLDICQAINHFENEVAPKEDNFKKECANKELFGASVDFVLKNGVSKFIPSIKPIISNFSCKSVTSEVLETMRTDIDRKYELNRRRNIPDQIQDTNKNFIYQLGAVLVSKLNESSDKSENEKSKQQENNHKAKMQEKEASLELFARQLKETEEKNKKMELEKLELETILANIKTSSKSSSSHNKKHKKHKHRKQSKGHYDESSSSSGTSSASDNEATPHKERRVVVEQHSDTSSPSSCSESDKKAAKDKSPTVEDETASLYSYTDTHKQYHSAAGGNHIIPSKSAIEQYEQNEKQKQDALRQTDTTTTTPPPNPSQNAPPRRTPKNLF
jgi:hypothetical protein